MRVETDTKDPLSEAVKGYCYGDNSEPQGLNEFNAILTHIRNGKVNGVDALVGSHLGPFLKHDDGFVRMRATKLLAQLIQRLSDKTLSEKAMGALLKFLTERFKTDYDSTVPCMMGMKFLLELHEKEFLGEYVPVIVNTVLCAHHVPAMTQAGRSLAFQIVNTILLRPKYCQALHKEMDGLSLITIYTDAVDGEKDPRCLITSLRNIALILRGDFAGLKFASIKDKKEGIERCFDVASVYFPIVFRPPSNDPFKIQVEDLWDALHGVFIAHKMMAPYVLRLLVDKLCISGGDDVVAAKLDSLKTLAKCIPAYGYDGIAPFIPKLRSLVLQTVMNAEDGQIQNEAIGVAGAVATVLAQVEDVRLAYGNVSSELHASCSDGWKEFVVAIVQECTDNIGKHIDSMVGWASGKLLESISRSGVTARKLVLETSLSIILSWCTKHDSTEAQRAAAFGLLCGLIESVDPSVEYSSEMQPFTSAIVESIYEALRGEIDSISWTNMAAGGEYHHEQFPRQSSFGSRSKCDALAALAKLVIRSLSLFYSTEKLQDPMKLLSSPLGIPNIDEDIRNACIEALKELGMASGSAANVIAATVLPYVFQKHEECPVDLTIVVKLCTIPAVFDAIVPHILTKWNFARLDVITNRESIIASIAEIVFACRSYSESLEKCCVPFTDKTLLLPTIFECINLGVYPDEGILRIIRTLCQNVSVEVQTVLMAHVISLLDKPLSPGVTVAIASVVGSVHPDVLLCERIDCERVTMKMLECALTGIDNRACQHCAKCLASLVNKLESKNSALIEEVVDNILGRLDDGALQCSGADIPALGALLWCGKALAMLCHPLCNKVDATVFRLICDKPTALSLKAADYFGMVLEPCSDMLNRESFTNENLFYRQRFFDRNFSNITTRLEKVSKEERYSREGLLLGAMFLMEFMTKTVLLCENINSVVILLLHGCESENLATKESALATLVRVVNDRLDATEPHLMRLIPLLLDMSCSKSGLDAYYRALALDCLFAFSSLPYNKIHRFQVQALRKLLLPLDDPRRGIRAKAVHCRNAWVALTNV